MCARYFLCFQVHAVSPAEDNSRDTIFKTLFWVFPILLSIFENLYVFLLNVKRDEFGFLLSRIPYLFRPLSAWHKKKQFVY